MASKRRNARALATTAPADSANFLFGFQRIHATRPCFVLLFVAFSFQVVPRRIGFCCCIVGVVRPAVGRRFVGFRAIDAARDRSRKQESFLWGGGRGKSAPLSSTSLQIEKKPIKKRAVEHITVYFAIGNTGDRFQILT